MLTRYVSRALVLAFLTCGGVVMSRAPGQAHDLGVLPERPGPVTVVGCFLHRPDRHPHAYVLVNPTIAPVTSVPNGTCAATGTEGTGEMLELRKAREKQMDDTMLGHWIEVSGQLGRVKDGDDLRKLRVKSFREVPVVAPRGAEAILQTGQQRAEPLKARPRPISRYFNSVLSSAPRFHTSEAVSRPA